MDANIIPAVQPKNSVEFVVLIISITVLSAFGLWLRLSRRDDGDKTRSDIQGSGFKSLQNDDRTNGLEKQIEKLWEAVDKIRDKQSGNSIETIKEIYEIKGMIEIILNSMPNKEIKSNL